MGSLKERYQLVDLGVNGRILIWALKKCDGVGWINLARDRAVVNTEMNARVP